MNLTPDSDVNAALRNGYPSNRQRREWTEEQWDYFNSVNDQREREERVAEETARELSPERLKERIDELEYLVQHLAQVVNGGGAGS